MRTSNFRLTSRSPCCRQWLLPLLLLLGCFVAVCVAGPISGSSKGKPSQQSVRVAQTTHGGPTQRAPSVSPGSSGTRQGTMKKTKPPAAHGQTVSNRPASTAAPHGQTGSNRQASTAKPVAKPTASASEPEKKRYPLTVFEPYGLVSATVNKRMISQRSDMLEHHVEAYADWPYAKVFKHTENGDIEVPNDEKIAISLGNMDGAEVYFIKQTPVLFNMPFKVYDDDGDEDYNYVFVCLLYLRKVVTVKELLRDCVNGKHVQGVDAARIPPPTDTRWLYRIHIVDSREGEPKWQPAANTSAAYDPQTVEIVEFRIKLLVDIVFEMEDSRGSLKRVECEVYTRFEQLYQMHAAAAGVPQNVSMVQYLLRDKKSGEDELDAPNDADLGDYEPELRGKLVVVRELDAYITVHIECPRLNLAPELKQIPIRFAETISKLYERIVRVYAKYLARCGEASEFYAVCPQPDEGEKPQEGISAGPGDNEQIHDPNARLGKLYPKYVKMYGTNWRLEIETLE